MGYSYFQNPYSESDTEFKVSLTYLRTAVDIASQLGMVRQQQGLSIDQQRLVIRIEGLEKIDDKD
jgi:integrase/recombinase XerD